MRVTRDKSKRIKIISAAAITIVTAFCFAACSMQNVAVTAPETSTAETEKPVEEKTPEIVINDEGKESSFNVVFYPSDIEAVLINKLHNF